MHTHRLYSSNNNNNNKNKQNMQQAYFCQNIGLSPHLILYDPVRLLNKHSNGPKLYNEDVGINPSCVN